MKLPCGPCCCLGCLRTSLTDNFKQLEKHPRTCTLKGDRIYWCPCVGNCAKQMSPLLVDGKLITLFIYSIGHAIIMYFSDIMMNLMEPHYNRSQLCFLKFVVFVARPIASCTQLDVATVTSFVRHAFRQAYSGKWLRNRRLAFTCI